MSAKKPAGSDMKTIIANDPEVLKGRLKYIGGSQSDHWNNILANQAIHALWLKHSDQETHDRQCGATVAALVGIGPKDELEGMMAAQLIAAHNAYRTTGCSTCSNGRHCLGGRKGLLENRRAAASEQERCKMTNPMGKGGFQRGQSGNPGGRPKLPADIREAFKAKAPAGSGSADPVPAVR